jgi:hypothetical protein
MSSGAGLVLCSLMRFFCSCARACHTYDPVQEDLGRSIALNIIIFLRYSTAMNIIAFHHERLPSWGMDMRGYVGSLRGRSGKNDDSAQKARGFWPTKLNRVVEPTL